MRMLFIFCMFLSVVLGAVEPKVGRPTRKERRPYRRINNELLSAMPERRQNKRVWFEGVYTGYSVTFLPYMERSGLKEGTDLALCIGSKMLPVIAKKTDLLISFVLEWKKGCTLRVYGVVRRFDWKPRQTLCPHYYVELRHVEYRSDPPERKTVIKIKLKGKIGIEGEAELKEEEVK